MFASWRHRIMDSALRESETSSSLLQLDDTRGLLDVVDRLRSQGISQYIDLPEIIVCGEQSSGKSSVLEAISGVMFPSKDNLCTRFATELVLRRGPATPIRIRIVPGPEERSEDDREKLRNFNVSVSSEDLKLGDVIEAAKEAMGINDLTKVFSKDILRLEISGPEQPHLTLVDLPGLFQAGSRSQSDEDSDTVKALVLSYMRRPRSIILAVVSAKNDFNNQSITRFAREIDQSGVRTLGLITKPDTLDEGSDSEKFYVQLAQNQDVKFRLGWHVLRNRDYSSRNLSMRERNDAEAQFFSCGIWQSLHPSKVGIHSLKPRLGQILKDQIIMQLPFVLSQIQNGLQDCANRMNILGPARATQMEQRRYLLRISKLFSDLIRAATEGSYSNPFFGSAASDEDYTKRLRAVLQNTLTDFAGAMSRSGHTFDILEEDHAGSPGQITRQDYLLTVRKHITRSRGRELPGTFDPLVIGDLFHEQRKPWTKLVDEYVGKVIRAVYHVVCAVLSYISDQSTSEGLLRHVIHPKLEQLTLGLQEKISEILEPYGSDHPITYNHYLTENVQKAQGTRFKREMKRSLEQFFDENGEIVAHRLNINSLVDVIVTKHEADMDDYASSYATDFMQSYYKVIEPRLG